MDARFKNAEDEFFLLKGQFTAGRITREEFEAALKKEMVRDEEGRYWILGLDSGSWYVHDGKDWVQADPPGAASAPPVSASPLAVSGATTRTSNRLPILAASGCLAIICLSLVAVGTYIYFNPAASRPTLAALAPTAVVSSPVPSAITTPTREQSVDVVPVSTSEPTATPPPPTDTPSPTPAFSPTPAVPPGFYITGLQTNPPKPIRRQDFSFDVRFLNATGSPRSYRWLVYIFRSDPSQQRNSLGETPSVSFSFPAGAGVVERGTWRLTGAGGCEDFVARVGWLDENRRPTMFAKPDGQVFEQLFTVCP